MNRAALHGRAFTLIEVLTAITVLAVLLPVIAAGFNIATDAAGVARDRTLATAVAQSVLDDVIAEQTWTNGGQTGDSGNFHWETTISDWDEVNTAQITVHVTWVHRSHNMDLSLSTVGYQSGSTLQTTMGGMGGIGGLP